MKYSVISDCLSDFLHHQFKQFSTRSSYALGMGALALFCMSLVNWTLLGAIALGLGVAWGVYEGQQPHRKWLERGRNALAQQWRTSVGKAAISGGSVTFLLLLGMGLANITGRGWIAATLILQSFMALGIWALWQQSNPVKGAHAVTPQPPSLDRYINDLAHPALMRRMIAVRRLHHLLRTQSIPAPVRHELRDYFQLLLTQETDAVIRLALQDALEVFYRSRAIRGGSMEDFTTVQVRSVTTESRVPSLSAVYR